MEVRKKDDIAVFFFSTTTARTEHREINCLSLSLPPSFSPPLLSALPNYTISQWEIGGEERLGFLSQQQLVHLFTPNLHANEAVSLHNLV